MSEDFVFFFVTLEILKCCRTVSLKRQFKSNKKGENRRKPDEREKGKEDGKKEDRQKKKKEKTIRLKKQKVN